MFAARLGGWAALPLAFAILLRALPVEVTLGKFVLGRLPASRKPEWAGQAVTREPPTVAD